MGDGHCLFHAFIANAAYHNLKTFTVKELRQICYEELGKLKSDLGIAFIDSLRLDIKDNSNISNEAKNKYANYTNDEIFQLYRNAIKDDPHDDTNPISHWGGEMEIEILAKHYDVQVCYFNNKGQRRCINEEKDGPIFYLKYNGLHYDALLPKPKIANYKSKYIELKNKYLQQQRIIKE